MSNNKKEQNVVTKVVKLNKSSDSINDGTLNLDSDSDISNELNDSTDDINSSFKSQQSNISNDSLRDFDNDSFDDIFDFSPDETDDFFPNDSLEDFDNSSSDESDGLDTSYHPNESSYLDDTRDDDGGDKKD